MNSGLRDSLENILVRVLTITVCECTQIWKYLQLWCQHCQYVPHEYDTALVEEYDTALVEENDSALIEGYGTALGEEYDIALIEDYETALVEEYVTALL